MRMKKKQLVEVDSPPFGSTDIIECSLTQRSDILLRKLRHSVALTSSSAASIAPAIRNRRPAAIR